MGWAPPRIRVSTTPSLNEELTTMIITRYEFVREPVAEVKPKKNDPWYNRHRPKDGRKARK